MAKDGRKSPWLDVVVGFSIAAVFIGLGLLLINLLDYYGYVSLSLTAPDPDDRIKYLLSATAQVLAALFALVFSITLIAVQFVTKYTHRTMRIVFNNRITILYMPVFAISVLIPLIWLLVYPTWGGAIMSLVVGGIVVLSLVPFFLYLRDRMKIDAVIEHLKNEGIKFIIKKEFQKAEESINALDSFIMGTFTDRNFEEFGIAGRALVEVALSIELRFGRLEDGSKLYIIHKSIFHLLQSACEEVIGNTRAPIILLDQIGLVCGKAMSMKCYATCYAAYELIDEIQFISDNNDRKKVSIACARALHNIVIKLPADISGVLLFESDRRPNASIILSIEKTEYELHKRHLKKMYLWDILQELRDTVELLQVMLRPNLCINEATWQPTLDHLFEYFDEFVKGEFSLGAKLFSDHVNNIIQFTLERNLPRRFISVFSVKLRENGDWCKGYFPDDITKTWLRIGEALTNGADILDIRLGRNKLT